MISNASLKRRRDQIFSGVLLPKSASQSSRSHCRAPSAKESGICAGDIVRSTFPSPSQFSSAAARSRNCRMRALHGMMACVGPMATLSVRPHTREHLGVALPRLAACADISSEFVGGKVQVHIDDAVRQKPEHRPSDPGVHRTTDDRSKRSRSCRTVPRMLLQSWFTMLFALSNWIVKGASVWKTTPSIASSVGLPGVSRDFDVAESVESKVRLEVFQFPSPAQCVGIGRQCCAQVLGVEFTVWL